jgi:hypothetical protein
LRRILNYFYVRIFFARTIFAVVIITVRVSHLVANITTRAVLRLGLTAVGRERGCVPSVG